jgi:exodeoxyribonuclease VII small subunit
MARETKAAKQEESFERLYGRLEETVGKLEAGGLSLDDAIALYEQGMSLARECQERLAGAEQRITKLRESFAPLARNNAAMLSDTTEDYEYVNDAQEPDEGDSDFP